MNKDEGLRKLNFDTFEKRYGFRPRVNENEDELYRIEEAENKEPVIYIRVSDTAGYIRINSTYSPSYEAARWAEKEEAFYRKTAVIFLGFSTGCYLNALMEKARPDTLFYVYEPEESLFAYLCAFADLSGIIAHKRIKLYISENQRKQMIEDMLPEVAAFSPDMRGIVTPFYSDSDEFRKICHELEALVGFKQAFQGEGSRQALRCRMRSWNKVHRGYLLPELKERLPEEIPVVIVAAGPSLNENVHILKNMKDKCLIMAADRALSVLDDAGIVPDVIVTLDSVKDPKYLEAKCAKESYLICSYQANPKAQEIFEDRCIYYHALRYEHELIGEKAGTQSLDQGGNVAGGCFVICEALGIKTVILIGQDLAYKNGRHHADDKDEGNPDFKKIMIEGIDGKPVESNEMWISNRDFLERQIAAHPDMEVIDATEGGALIHGTKIMTLRDVADKIGVNAYEVNSFFADMQRAQSDEEYRLMLTKIKSWIDDLDEVVAKSKEVEELCSQLLKVSKYQDISDAKYDKKKNKLFKVRLDIMEKTVNGLLEDFWIDNIFDIPEAIMMLRNNDEAKVTLESAERYYICLQSSAKELKKELLDVFGED